MIGILYVPITCLRPYLMVLKDYSIPYTLVLSIPLLSFNPPTLIKLMGKVKDDKGRCGQSGAKWQNGRPVCGSVNTNELHLALTKLLNLGMFFALISRPVLSLSKDQVC